MHLFHVSLDHSLCLSFVSYLCIGTDQVFSVDLSLSSPSPSPPPPTSTNVGSVQSSVPQVSHHKNDLLK